jgi:hypothetical protein
MADLTMAPFTADGSSDFVSLRTEIRDCLRVTETSFRRIMKDMLERLPPEAAKALAPLEVELPAKFLLGLYPFFESLSVLQNRAEMRIVPRRGTSWVGDADR